MKHARASRIEVSFAARNGSLLLSIRDDGVGGPIPRTFRLVGLADRVEALGGSIRLHSPAGPGCTSQWIFRSGPSRLRVPVDVCGPGGAQGQGVGLSGTPRYLRTQESHLPARISVW
jgi:hypothetical protein